MLLPRRVGDKTLLLATKAPAAAGRAPQLVKVSVEVLSCNGLNGGDPRYEVQVLSTEEKLWVGANESQLPRILPATPENARLAEEISQRS